MSFSRGIAVVVSLHSSVIIVTCWQGHEVGALKETSDAYLSSGQLGLTWKMALKPERVVVMGRWYCDVILAYV